MPARKFLLILSEDGDEFTSGHGIKFEDMDALAHWVVDELDFGDVARCFEDHGDDEPARSVTRDLAEAVAAYIQSEVDQRHSDDDGTWKPSDASYALLRRFNIRNAHDDVQSGAWINERAA